MFDRLKEIVFGLGEYEKTRIDIRFELVYAMIPSLKVSKIENFEILEDVISKIKEQLRIKSSNLNKVIQDSSKSLKKKDVVNLISDLNKIKYDFLKRAFTLIEKIDSKVFDNVIDDRIKEDMILKREFNKLIYENKNYKISLENGIVPYILVNFFNDEIDYNLLKSLSSIFYEIYNCDGSNVIVENKKAMIVPRFNEDNLFKLPKEECDLDEIFNKLVSTYDNVEKDEIKQDEDNYVEINSRAKFKSKRGNDSLDNLLESDFKKEITHPNPREDSSKIEIIEDDKIEIEKKPFVKEEEFEIEFEKDFEKNDEKNKIKEIDVTKIENLNLKNFEIYRDEKIVAYLKEDSKVLGEIFVESIENKNLEDFSEGDLAYINLFVKAFSTYLFEVVHAHATNIIYDYNSRVIRLIPRYQEDGLDLMWKPIAIREDELESIKINLIEKMLNHDVQKKVKEKTKVDSDMISKENQDEIKLTIENRDDEKKKKVEAILASLNRIP